ncbi:MAG: NAD(P)H-dependent oxidoreductase [Synechococcaceae cyanobacterium SM2_3_2]|nr:NAD(P)H-dependent oxidoreductase [Synechococcaceae cyanobacterium SM2_3_2]
MSTSGLNSSLKSSSLKSSSLKSVIRQPKLVAIGGSLRPESHTYQALQSLAQRIRARGVELEILDLRQMTLPFCDGSGDYNDFPDVARLQEAVKQADGVILATPEYHGSLSGVLKNALDLLSFEQLEGKVLGLISILGGTDNSNALNHLRLIGRWVRAWVIPEQIAVSRAWGAFDGQGQIKDEQLQERFDRFAASMIVNTAKLRGIPLPESSAVMIQQQHPTAV